MIYAIFKQMEYNALGIGLLISILLLVPYIAYMLSYNQTHAEGFSKNLFKFY